jgi:hypothetical protein
MRFVRAMRLTVVLFAVCILLAAAVSARPQDAQSQQDQSAADAAKRNREKKKASTKPAKVITNEDLDKGTFVPGQSGVNIGGPAQLETTPPSPEAVAKAEAADKAAEKAAADKDPGDDAQVVELKKQVAEAAKELDLLQREFALDSEAYYSKTDFASDKAGKAKLDGEQQQIAAKQQELDGLKVRLTAAQEAQKRRKAASTKPPAPVPNEQPANPQPPQP